ncbi:hypothetical protein DSO57_1035570 [Entomophthora muscae]|uniref:Uncharacterized protein n=1 Tax=Entomophthora muscae TaxID=34485 RepID=A0ACC2TY39_9FUNG|nr:hypothetical protein DSO57_1035570 [Entomophthora muscae]
MSQGLIIFYHNERKSGARADQSRKQETSCLQIPIPLEKPPSPSMFQPKPAY